MTVPNTFGIMAEEHLVMVDNDMCTFQPEKC